MSKKNRNVQTFIDEPQVDEELPAETPEPESDLFGDVPPDENDGSNDDSDESKDEPAKAVEYVVNPDRPAFSICGTRKGVIVQGDKVTPEMFRGGQAVFNSLLASGAIVEKKD